MHKFFDRPPYEVATELVGKTLQVGDRKGVVTKTKPQYPTDNSNWTDRPLFGSHPVDAYVAEYRGKCLLFLRTGIPGVNTCVRIDGVEVDGQLYASPARACEVLGINSERSGKVAFSRNVISLSWS